MKTLLFVAALAGITACDKKSDSGGSGGGGTAAAAEIPCSTAINKAIDGMIATRQKMIDSRAQTGDTPPPGMMAQMTDVANKLRVVLTTRCTADAWPQAVLGCFAAASDQPGIKKCRELLPPELGQRLQLEVVKVMSAGRAGGPPGGMGGPPPGGMGGPMGGGPHGGPGGRMGSDAAPADTGSPAAPAGSATKS